MRTNPKILYICQEITPYLPETEMSVLCRTLSQAMQERGNEIRTFMPRYGCINERRNQLHEVIRLSGMNLIIDNNDHQLIIKVASIPSARVQIYFIDNDDYFSRKALLTDETGQPFPDNDRRAIFFARGVLETVKKLCWKPDIVHCHGWFASIIPLYLRHGLSDDPLFKNLKVVVSLYDDAFPGTLSEEFLTTLEHEGVPAEQLKKMGDPTYENLMKFVIDYADGVVIDAQNPAPELTGYLASLGKQVFPLQDKTTTQYLDNYQQFYEELL